MTDMLVKLYDLPMPSREAALAERYTAANADGFEIDVVRRAVKDGDLHPLRVSQHEADFWAVQIPQGTTLLDGATSNKLW
jgi:hypothetical protein